MTRVRFEGELADAMGVDSIDAEGVTTLHSFLDQVAGRVGEEKMERVIHRRPGERFRLRDDVDVLVNDRSVRDHAGLSTPLAPGDDVVVRPRE